jgi:uncharacterized protein (UPF0297 family)
MAAITEETMVFLAENYEHSPAKILNGVCQAMKTKGYNPINQLTAYLISGDSTYITSYNNARGLIRKIEREELMEELLRIYLQGQYGNQS